MRATGLHQLINKAAQEFSYFHKVLNTIFEWLLKWHKVGDILLGSEFKVGLWGTLCDVKKSEETLFWKRSWRPVGSTLLCIIQLILCLTFTLIAHEHTPHLLLIWSILFSQRGVQDHVPRSPSDGLPADPHSAVSNIKQLQVVHRGQGHCRTQAQGLDDGVSSFDTFTFKQ